jgi:gliding motility-associated-like protein
MLSHLRFLQTVVVAFLLSLQSVISAFGQCGACEYNVDLVTNGSFTQGNSGFTSDYSPASGFFCPLCPEGVYGIGTNALLFNFNFAGTDHTNPPNGSFFIANGATVNNARVWCQTFNVQPFTDYTLQFFGRDISTNTDPHPLAIISASFNGITVGDSLSCSNGWQEQLVTWNSGNATTLELCLINHQNLGGGNDFGLDDIRFTGCHTYNLTSPAFAGQDQTVCSGQSISIGQEPAAGYTYQWNIDSFLSSTSVSNPSITPIHQGLEPLVLDYILQTDSAQVGCITTDTVRVTVLPTPPFELETNVVLCENEEYTFSIPPLWNEIAWNTGQNEFEWTTGEAGIYWATVNYNGCLQTDSTTISIIAYPNWNLPDSVTSCAGQTVLLETGVQGTWNGLILSDTYLSTSSETAIFQWQEASCSLTDSVVIAFLEYPEVQITGNSTLCEGSTQTLTSNEQGLWNTGDLGFSTTIVGAGTYDIDVYNGPCLTTASIEVEELPLPVFPSFSDTSICEDSYLTLQAFHPANTSYLWNTGDTTSFITVNQPGVYELAFSNPCGTEVFSVELDTYPCSWDLFIPNAFSPNNDGVNDSWQIKGYNMSNVDVQIFNRLGNLIYSGAPSEPWSPGSGVGQDSYTYRVVGSTIFGETVERVGHVHVIR